jgi:hypothetical protein
MYAGKDPLSGGHHVRSSTTNQPTRGHTQCDLGGREAAVLGSVYGYLRGSLLAECRHSSTVDCEYRGRMTDALAALARPIIEIRTRRCSRRRTSARTRGRAEPERPDNPTAHRSANWDTISQRARLAGVKKDRWREESSGIVVVVVRLGCSSLGCGGLGRDAIELVEQSPKHAGGHDQLSWGAGCEEVR